MRVLFWARNSVDVARLGFFRLRMHWLQVVTASWEDALQEQEGMLSGILSNPPYIASRVIKTLQVTQSLLKRLACIQINVCLLALFVMCTETIY